MSNGLKASMAAFYVLATVLMGMVIYQHTDRSWLVIAHTAALWMVAVLLPARWIALLSNKLRERGVATDDLQIILLMPAWCAVMAALIALQFMRP
jgi:hypothetical protein